MSKREEFLKKYSVPASDLGEIEVLLHEYLKDCVQGIGANEWVSYAEALYAVQLAEEEILSELQDKDAVTLLEKSAFHTANGDMYSGAVTKSRAKEALAIQQANFEKKAIMAFNNSCALMQDCKHCPGDCFCEENFKQQLNIK